jgi:hypothetical protein
LSAGPDYGARVDFRSRKLVGIGHSLGGVSMYVGSTSFWVLIDVPQNPAAGTRAHSALFVYYSC